MACRKGAGAQGVTRKRPGGKPEIHRAGDPLTRWRLATQIRLHPGMMRRCDALKRSLRGPRGFPRPRPSGEALACSCQWRAEDSAKRPANFSCPV